ncbi:MAG: hypothetical protein KGL74_09410 [Elusimicrobia bacterium]|nr:hypothetical protein [Elusimicrobiota bacterium]
MKSETSWVIGPRADWINLSLAPLWALALGLAIGRTPLGTLRIPAFGRAATPADGFIAVFIFAHLFLVFFRSHGNPDIRRLHPVRFLVVPPALFILFVAWPLARAAGAVLAIWWDVYHSSLQTFGIGRIFDMKSGNDPEEGRAMDVLLNLFLYVGPVLGGALLMYHARSFYELSDIGFLFFGTMPAKIIALQGRIRLILIAVGIPFLACYAVYYSFLIHHGYKVDRRKIALYLSTAACSIWAWGFNPLGMGLFIMNFFHAWQYFALVWRYEGAAAARVLRVKEGIAAFAAMTGVAFLYGALGNILGEFSNLALSATLVVSLMHFWYDGFVWSVRKGQV